MLKILFVVIAAVFSISIILGKLHFFKLKDPMKVSDYVASIAALVGLYSIMSIVLMFTSHSLQTRLVMLFFALSPFIIGSLATYELEKIFTRCQVLLIWVSIAYVILYV